MRQRPFGVRVRWVSEVKSGVPHAFGMHRSERVPRRGDGDYRPKYLEEYYAGHVRVVECRPSECRYRRQTFQTERRSSQSFLAAKWRSMFPAVRCQGRITHNASAEVDRQVGSPNTIGDKGLGLPTLLTGRCA